MEAGCKSFHSEINAIALLVSINSVVSLSCTMVSFRMHDEAITRYDSQVMQMTYGHKSLQRMFDSFSDTSNEHAGVTKRMNLNIRTGWQIDSSGASQFSASLHPQAFPDFRVLILNKLPQTIKDEMKSKQKLEFHWEIYQDPNYNILLGKDCTINGAKPYKYRVFVHVLDTNYTSHAGYDWESIEQPSKIISDLNVMEKSGLFMDMIRQKSEYYTTNNVFIPFGGDFRFQNAKLQFENMEKIMQYVNDHPERFDNATLRFSTVNEYMNHIDQAVNSSNLTQGEDFFPTVSFSPLLPHWTGYYTQFPILKQMVRTCEQLLRFVVFHLLLCCCFESCFHLIFVNSHLISFVVGRIMLISYKHTDVESSVLSTISITLFFRHY